MEQAKALPPFSCTYSLNIPELLQQLKASIVISTYQAGKVIIIGPKNRDELIQQPRNFPKPMGIAVEKDRMAIATNQQVYVMNNVPDLASTYPRQPHTYDALYMPTTAYYTSMLDLHDLEFGKDGLYAVNTLFSCISKISDRHSFEPTWFPPFISGVSGDDRCHLNGMALIDGVPRFATALGETDEKEEWRTNMATGGILMDIEKNEVIARNLGMPHTPKYYKGKLYMLLSATGELVEVNQQTGEYEVIKSFDGFVRGMSIYEDYAFIGLSKLRKTNKAFGKLPIAQKSVICGIAVVHLPMKSFIGQIKYENSVEEIYDVKILPGHDRPGLLSPMKDDFLNAIHSPVSNGWFKADNS